MEVEEGEEEGIKGRKLGCKERNVETGKAWEEGKRGRKGREKGRKGRKMIGNKV